MGRTGKLILALAVVGLASIFLSLSLSPLSGYDPADGLPGWIDDVYLRFDSLKTDPADYAFPTEASHTLTSGFAEFRTMHFHAGIDLSTHGRTGYKVFASRSGYISRISINPYGYGRMLQVRHPDGFTTVYAHLSRFSDRLEEFAHRKQYENERYSLEERFDTPEFAVEKGDVIAYTGDTGVGPAHFHFEVRDERMNPVNPLLFPEFEKAIVDTRFPEFHQINFIPYDFASRVNRSPRPVVESVRRKKDHDYMLPRIVHLTGLVGLSVLATDRVDATWHRNGIYHYELYLDSTLVYTSRLDRFSAKETEQIALHYDWPMVQAGEGRFQKLFLEPGNHLPLYDRSPERSGILETPRYTRGEHHLLIIAQDTKGNTSRCTATVVFDDPPAIDVHQSDGKLVLIPPGSAELHSISVGTKRQGAKKWNVRTYLPSSLASARDGYVLPVEPGSQLVRVLAKDDHGTSSYPVFVVPENPHASNTSLAIRKEFIRDYVSISVSSHLPFTLRPSVWIVNGTQKSLVEINAVNERSYNGTFPLSALHGGEVRLEANAVVNGTRVESFDDFSVFPITPDEGGTIVAGGGEFSLEFPSHAVYQTLYCRVKKTGDGYAVFPQDVLLDRGATVLYRAADSSTAGLGMYFTGEDGDEGLLARKESGGVFRGHVSQLLGDFSLKRDLTPPTIQRFRARAKNGTLHLSFRVRDRRSGVSPNSIRITIDGKLLIAPYDPYSHTVAYSGPFDLHPGVHVVTIETADRMGNESHAQHTFRSR